MDGSTSLRTNAPTAMWSRDQTLWLVKAWRHGMGNRMADISGVPQPVGISSLQHGWRKRKVELTISPAGILSIIYLLPCRCSSKTLAVWRTVPILAGIEPSAKQLNPWCMTARASESPAVVPRAPSALFSSIIIFAFSNPHVSHHCGRTRLYYLLRDGRRYRTNPPVLNLCRVETQIEFLGACELLRLLHRNCYLSLLHPSCLWWIYF